MSRDDLSHLGPRVAAACNAQGHVYMSPKASTSDLGHELVHRGQMQRAGANAQRALDRHHRRVDRHPPNSREAYLAYLEDPTELMAHAYQVARILKIRAQMRGQDPFEVLRNGSWADYSSEAHEVFSALRGRPSLRRFLKYVADYLEKPMSWFRL